MTSFHGIDRSGWSVFRDVQIRIAPRIARPRVHVNRNRIIGEVRIVHAIAGHTLAGSPLAALLEHFAQSSGKLLGRLLEHFDFVRRATSRIGNLDDNASSWAHVEHLDGRFDSPPSDLDALGRLRAKPRRHVLRVGNNETRATRRCSTCRHER